MTQLLNNVKILFILTILTYKIGISDTYQHFLIEDDKLCSPITKRKVILQKAELSGLVISLNNVTKLMEHAQKWEDDHFICEFQVNTEEKHNGIFAVIQNIVLRRNELTNECIDYIQYRTVNSTFRSKKFCGQVDGDHLLRDLLPTSDSFVEASIALDVYINISKQPLEPFKNLELEVVFTSFRYCIKKLSFDDQWCSPNHTVHCINKRFFNDGYVNCPYPGCVDEPLCVPKIGNSFNKVGFSPLAATFTGLALFVISASASFLFVRKYCRKSSQNSTDNQPQFVEMHPMPQIDFDDRPPSYDSLFPRTAPAN